MMDTPAQRGFRRCYELQLFQSFGWLAVCLLSGVAFAAILEFVGLRTPGFTPLITVLVLYLIGCLALAAFRHFWLGLAHAQHCASKATCENCGAYGLFDVKNFKAAIPAHCRRCGHRWMIRPKVD